MPTHPSDRKWVTNESVAADTGYVPHRQGHDITHWQEAPAPPSDRTDAKENTK